MIDLYKQIDFTKKGEDNDIEYEIFLKEAAKEIAKEEEDQIKKIKRPQFDQQLENHLIVTGIPVLKAETKQKFLKVFQSFMDKKKIGKENGLVSIDVGMDNQVGNQTLYIIYKLPSEAKSAFKKLDNLKFDKDHTLKCFTVKEIHQVMKFNPEYKEPKLFYSQDLNKFNFEHDRMDQFIVREGNDIMVRWLDHIDKSTESAIQFDYIRNDAAKLGKIGFSPKGKYLVTCSDKGTYLYGGKNFELKGFYPQESPVDFKFSPDEKYMITFNGTQVKSKENFIIWGVEEQIKLKSYRSYLGQTLESFQFNNKSTLFAVASINEIFFYNLDSIEHFKQQLKLSDEESSNIKANHIQKISWLQDNKSIICLCYEIDYNPNSMAATKVFIYNVETKVERKWRTWTEHVKKGDIVVSERGDWVAVIMRKFLKKNHYSTVIQVGNLLRTDDPIEISSIEIKEVIGNVSWDFKSNKFAIIHEDESTRRGINVKHIVQFYQIATKGKKLDLVKIEEVKNVLSNRVIIAHGGAFFAVYNISESSPERGKVSFGLFLREKKDKKSSAIQWIKQNIMIHQLSFFKVDASGRFVLLGTQKSYQVWSIIGEMIFKDTLLKPVNSLQWRPRNMKNLSEEGEDKLVQEEKEIKKKYEDLDARKLDFLKYQKEELRKQRQAQFLAYLQKKRQWSTQFIEKRKKILGFDQILSRTAVYEVVTDIEIV